MTRINPQEGCTLLLFIADRIIFASSQAALQSTSCRYIFRAKNELKLCGSKINGKDIEVDSSQLTATRNDNEVIHQELLRKLPMI